MDINILLAFGAGFLSFISPCTIPLYPAFLSYITGVSYSDLHQKGSMKQKGAILHTVCFLLGFTLIFVALGFGTSFVSRLFIQYDELIRQIGGILIVVFGLVVAGIFTPTFLMKERRLSFEKRPSGYIGSAIIGLVFAAGWTPCTGPILAAIFLLGSTAPQSAVFYMLAYVIGFSIPFFVLAFFMPKVSFFRKNSQKIVRFGGYVMVIAGIMLFFNWFAYANVLLAPLFGDFIGF